MNLMSRLSTGFLSASVIFLAACSTPYSSTKPTTVSMADIHEKTVHNTEWSLELWNDQEGVQRTIQTSSGHPLNLNFSQSDGQLTVSGYAGCNRFFGSYKVTAGQLQFIQPFGATRMACSQGMDIEQRYLNALMQVKNTYTDSSINANYLTLELDNGDKLLFKRIISPFAHLQKTGQIFVNINHQTVPCSTGIQAQCLQFRMSAEEPWQTLRTNIHGFKPEPGMDYQLRLNVYKDPKNPSAPQTWELDMVVMVGKP